MADDPHTIDRWDDATGVIEQIAGVTDMPAAVGHWWVGRGLCWL